LTRKKVKLVFYIVGLVEDKTGLEDMAVSGV
jgi:hypothetical protein